MIWVGPVQSRILRVKGEAGASGPEAAMTEQGWQCEAAAFAEGMEAGGKPCGQLGEAGTEAEVASPRASRRGIALKCLHSNRVRVVWTPEIHT